MFNADQTAFLELIKAALFQRDFTVPTNVNWDGVYELAVNHCVVSLIEPYVPIDYKRIWEEGACRSRARFIQNLFEQNELIKLFNEKQIAYVIIKGTAAAMYYPVPSNRAMGDIDLFVAPVVFPVASELMLNNGYRTIHDNGRHVEYEKHGVIFELHRKVSSQLCNDIDDVVIDGMQHSVEYRVCNSMFAGLPVFVNGLVILNHLLQHIKGEGIGFRQIIDWMMFVNQELDDDIWNNTFSKLTRDFGLEKTAITITYMCKRWLGLPKDITWCDDADGELAASLILQIFHDGNFMRERSLSENAINVSNSIKREGLFHYLQRSGMYNWKSSQKQPLLRPFAWLYQLGRCIVKGIISLVTGRRILRGYKQKLNFDEIISRLEDHQ